VLKTLRFITSHPLTRDRPLAALWRFAKWQVRSRLQAEVIVNQIDKENYEFHKDTIEITAIM
jgi:hypothetical protein